MFGMDQMAKQFLSTPEGQKMVVDFISSPEGVATLKKIIGTPEGKKAMVSLLKTALPVLGLSAEDLTTISRILNTVL